MIWIAEKLDSLTVNWLDEKKFKQQKNPKVSSDYLVAFVLVFSCELKMTENNMIDHLAMICVCRSALIRKWAIIWFSSFEQQN